MAWVGSSSPPPPPPPPPARPTLDRLYLASQYTLPALNALDRCCTTPTGRPARGGIRHTSALNRFALRRALRRGLNPRKGVLLKKKEFSVHVHSNRITTPRACVLLAESVVLRRCRSAPIAKKVG